VRFSCVTLTSSLHRSARRAKAGPRQVLSVTYYRSFSYHGSERLIWPFGRTKPIFSIPFKELHFEHRCRDEAPRPRTLAVLLNAEAAYAPVQ
jgi:hypothetical protein